MTTNHETRYARNANYGIVSVVLGPAFVERAPFSTSDWLALERLSYVALGFGSHPLWRAPLSFVLNDARQALHSVAIFVSSPPQSNVQVVLLDERGPDLAPCKVALDRARVPHLLWRGAENIETTMLDLKGFVSADRVPRKGKERLNPFEAKALATVREFIEAPPPDFGDLLEPLEAAALLAWLEPLVGTGSDPVRRTRPSRNGPRLLACPEMSLCAVTQLESDLGSELNQRTARQRFLPAHRYWERASLDIVVFPGALDCPPLFAIEVDGPRHGWDAEKQKNDELKNTICSGAGLPLIRIGINELPDPKGDSSEQEAAMAIWQAKQLWHRAIQVLAQFCLMESAEFKERRLRIQRAERAATLRLFLDRGITIANARDRADEILDIKYRVSHHFMDYYHELHHQRRETPRYFPPAPTPQDANRPHELEQDLQRVFEEVGLDIPRPNPGDLNVTPPIATSFVLDAIARGLGKRGFIFRGPRLSRDDCGTTALWELTDLRTGQTLRNSTPALELSGESPHIDLSAVESKTAALVAVESAVQVALARSQ
ncbi:MAG TPA: DUF2726 domain-containing protein [Casimicrobiaceae bacterium]|jgi:hypothetical protein|nr:DUF2726 domain-containing protein [Casimicrobiaceae bacterium]